MKSYTNIEESKKLAEILPAESADMEYLLEQWIDENTGRHKEKFYKIPVVKVDDDPLNPLQPITLDCWSLAALIEVLPLGVDIHNITDGHKIYYYVEIYTKEIYMKLKRMNKPEICLSTERHENLVDACVEMIVILKNKNLI